MNEQEKVIYVAALEYGKPHLTRLWVKKETDKSYIVGRREVLTKHGFYLPNIISKEKYHCFDNPADALNYLIDRATAYRDGCLASLAKAEDVLVDLIEMRELRVEE